MILYLGRFLIMGNIKCTLYLNYTNKCVSRIKLGYILWFTYVACDQKLRLEVSVSNQFIHLCIIKKLISSRLNYIITDTEVLAHSTC